MKRRVTALVISLVLLLGVLPAAAQAAFSDLVSGGDYAWAYSYIEDMTSRGFYQGHPDGTFRPGDELTLEQAYALAVRLCNFDSATKEAVTEDYAEVLDGIFGTDRSYFRTEFAAAIELSIVTPSLLAEQYESGALAKPLTREEFSRILVITMQLLPPVTGWKLEFNDADDINRAYAEYVYSLSSLGIVVGDTGYNFNPSDTIRRADSATMLSRAIAYLEQNGIVPELFNYTDYSAVSGSIIEAKSETDGSVTLTLARDYLPDTVVVIPAAATVYEHNVVTAKSDLETGRFCRVLSDKTRGVFAVRLYSAPMRYTGSIRGIGATSVTIDTGTATRTFEIDRLTVVTAARGLDGKIAALGINDTAFESSDYVTAECNVDETGRLVSLNLIGGTRYETAIFRKLEGGVVYVDSFAGVSYQLPLAANATIALDGIKAAATTNYSTHSGRAVWLVISNTTGEATVLDIDTKTTYVQGGLVRVTTRSNANSVITVSDPDTKKETGYVVTSNVKAYFDGSQVTLSSLEKGSFVTLRLESGNAAEVLATIGTYTIEGELVKITYGSTILLDIATESGKLEVVSLDASKLPSITRASKNSGIDKLMSGDVLVVTITYNRIVSIASLPPTADVQAVVKSLSVIETGTFLSVTLADGSEAIYTIASGVSISQNGKTATLSQIKSGTKVALVLSGTTVSAIEIEGQTVTSGELSGVIKFINTSDRTMLVEVDGEIRSVSVPITANVVNSKGQSAQALLVIEAAVQIFGEYDTAGNFVATLVIIK